MNGLSFLIGCIPVGKCPDRFQFQRIENIDSIKLPFIIQNDFQHISIQFEVGCVLFSNLNVTGHLQRGEQFTTPCYGSDTQSVSMHGVAMKWVYASNSDRLG